jgi:hypothetical protein
MDGQAGRLASVVEGDDRVALYRAQSAASFSVARAAARPFGSEELEARPDQCEPGAE